HAAVAVAPAAHELGRRWRPACRPFHDHDIVAEAVHLGERELHGGWQCARCGLMSRPAAASNVCRAEVGQRQIIVDSIWSKPPRVFRDLREFLAHLETRGELTTIAAPVSPALEITEISRRVLAKRGPALMFTNASPRGIRVLANLFGTEERVAAAIGADSREALGELGKLLAALRAPQ